MLTCSLDEKYISLVKDIINNDEFSSLENVKHHDNNRFNHCLKVSYYSYKVSKMLGLDYCDVARAGLLHDFYLGQVNEQKNLKDKILLFTTKHPEEAVNNASKYFNLSEKEKDIIRTHMFPIDIKIPKYAESWIVSIVDKIVSTKEFFNKFSTKLSIINNIYILIIFKLMR